MKLFQPRRTPHPTPEISKNLQTPVDKTDKTPPEVGFGGFVNAPRGGSENFTPPAPDPNPRESLTQRLLEAGRALGWSATSLEGWQSWAATASLDTLEARVKTTEARLRSKWGEKVGVGA